MKVLFSISLIILVVLQLAVSFEITGLGLGLGLGPGPAPLSNLIEKSEFLRKAFSRAAKIQNPKVSIDSKDRKLNSVITDISEHDDLMDIDFVTLEPDYPKRGTNITFYAGAYFREEIPQAEAHVIVKYGYIRLVNSKYDLCQLLLENSDLRCPLQPGYTNLNITVSLPSLIPPGNFYIDATAYRVSDSRQIGKIQGVASF
ncbi:hypothetical protein BB560_005573 [Smittium megazygosporum]|uniref:Phosphatidylglycerol/phosphatidylinositol transfer protein n=1 Tax=Smittium megazygosporum TaxID=133381 RepID=A0A2T9Z2N6_9FUNG|nr:hypothetical protein BB560_005597 [Smittium megazygosporum]PVU98967.1 hypothetical protein BB560_005573 [Smittium megazygosporum]